MVAAGAFTEVSGRGRGLLRGLDGLINLNSKPLLSLRCTTRGASSTPSAPITRGGCSRKFSTRRKRLSDPDPSSNNGKSIADSASSMPAPRNFLLSELLAVSMLLAEYSFSGSLDVTDTGISTVCNFPIAGSVKLLRLSDSQQSHGPRFTWGTAPLVHPQP